MTDRKPYAAGYDGAMQSSANALTRKLHATVMDVFGNYVANDEDEYKKMVDTLRNKQMKKQQDPPAAKANDNMRGVIAKKLLDGYVLHGDVCDTCVMPLMAYDGHISCVVCEKVDDLSRRSDSAVSKSICSAELTLTSTTESESSEYERENRVNEELSHFNERRIQSTDVYATKILAGYTMQDQLCSNCDLPMMRYKDSVDCVLCPKRRHGETLVSVVNNMEGGASSESSNMIASDEPAETSKPAKKLSQAEVIVERLRSMQSNSGGEKTESKIEKAERELLEMIGSLGMQGNQEGDVGGALQDYFSERKAERAALQKLQELQKLADEAKADAVAAASEEEAAIPHAMQARPEPIVTVVVTEADDIITQPVAIATPRFEYSVSCSLGDSIFGLKRMFASASDPSGVDEEFIVNEATPSNSRLEAKERIAMLVNDGWEVSSTGCCPKCDLPLFSNIYNAQIANGMKRCVMCGPIAENVSHNCAPGSAHRSTRTQKQVQEDITQKMINRITEGWDIVNGSQCPACRMPVMLNPHTRLTHCLACEVQATTINIPLTSFSADAMQSKLASLPVSKTAENPSKGEMQNRLKVDIVAEPTYTTLPDPTTSMTELRGQYAVDPPPSIQTSKDKLKVTTTSGAIRYITGEPTPAANTAGHINYPTPNMQSVRNKQHIQHLGNAPKPVRFKLNEPTPNMHAVRNKLNEP